MVNPNIENEQKEEAKQTEAQAQESDEEASEIEAALLEEPEEIDPLEEARKEAEDYKDRFLRLAAEFENYKKRKDKEFEALVRQLRERWTAQQAEQLLRKPDLTAEDKGRLRDLLNQNK